MRVFCDSIRGEGFFATVQEGFFATVSGERVFLRRSKGGFLRRYPRREFFLRRCSLFVVGCWLLVVVAVAVAVAVNVAVGVGVVVVVAVCL